LPLRALSFDLDGTIADTIPVCVRAFQATFREHLGRELAQAEVTAMFGPSEEGIFRRLLGPRWQPAHDFYLAEYERLHDACPRPFPGLVDLLDELGRRRVRLAVVTGKGPESAAISLRCLGVARYFEVVAAGSPQGAIKADCLERLVAGWALPARDVCHVGDSPTDVLSARRAGVTAAAAAWAPDVDRARLSAAEPDCLFDEVRAFAAWTLAAC
jgi:phosphoglycolate phosphatase-like HAD superfamily hydrolase